MALTPQEITQWVQDRINADRLTWMAQNDVSFERGLHHKYDHQLIAIIDQYKLKYVKLVERYKEHLDGIQGMITNFDISQADLKDDLLGLKDKVIRMADKYWAVKWEIEGRRLDIFQRTPVGTTYYIDLDNGNDSNDGLSTGQAWLTLEKYTTVTVRSAGDLGFLRANTDEIPAGDIVHDEDGDPGNPIQIIGCDSIVNDPWSDGSDVKPIIDFNGGAYRVSLAGNEGWKYKRIEVKGGTVNNMIDHGGGGSQFCIWKDCKIHEFGGNWNNMIGLGNAAGWILFDGCELDEVGANNRALGVNSGFAICRNCTLDGGSVSQGTTGISSVGGRIALIDCVFGGTTSFSGYDINPGAYFLYAYARNTLFDKGPNFGSSGGSVLISEDHNQVHGAGYIETRAGTIIKDTTIKTGNADFSLKMEPSSYCDTVEYLELSGNRPDMKVPFIIWGTADTEITITIKIRALGTWSTYPTAAQLYIEASYYDSDADLGRSTIKSTQVLSDASSWVDFTVTLTPERSGPIYVNAHMCIFEDAGDGCYINGEAVTS